MCPAPPDPPPCTAASHSPADGAPAALYSPPATTNALALSEDAQVAVASGSGVVILNASRLGAARAAACIDAGAASSSLPRSVTGAPASASAATAPALGDVGGEPAGPDRPLALAFHLRLRELADAMAGSLVGGVGGAGAPGSGAPTAAEEDARSLPPVQGLAWAPAGAAGVGGGCLLALLAAGDQVREKKGETGDAFPTPDAERPARACARVLNLATLPKKKTAPRPGPTPRRGPLVVPGLGWW